MVTDSDTNRKIHIISDNIKYYFKTIQLYVVEIQTYTKREKYELQAAEIPEGIVGKTRRDRIRKTYVRGELKMEEI